MRRILSASVLVGLAAILVGCGSMGEQTAPKPDPAQFMKNNPPSQTGGGSGATANP